MDNREDSASITGSPACVPSCEPCFRWVGKLSRWVSSPFARGTAKTSVAGSLGVTPSGNASSTSSLSRVALKTFSATSTSRNKWHNAVDGFKSQVGHDVYVSMCMNSSNRLVEQKVYKLLSQLNEKSKEKDALERLQPLLRPLQIVEELATIIAPTSPEVGFIIWGSLTILTMKTRTHARLVELVSGYLSRALQDWVRFKRYIDLFPQNEPLHRATEAYCWSLIHFLGFSANLAGHSRSGLPMSYERQMEKFFGDMQQTAAQVQQEFDVAKYESDEAFKKAVGRVAPAPQETPSTLKYVDIVPTSKFCGRDAYLEELRQRLLDQDDNPSPGQSILLHGLGGMGKSELARKFISDHDHVYPYVFWLPADTQPKLSSYVRQILTALKVSFDSSRDEVSFVWRNWLNLTDSWLLVFDNAEEESFVKEFWPQSKRGTVIVTSRRPNHYGTLVAHEMAITAMPMEHSIELLYKLLPVDYKRARPDQSIFVEKICGFADGLPLAIIFAASLIRGCMMSFQDAFETLEKSRQLLIEWNLNDRDTHATLEATLKASISRLPTGALDLLRIMAFLDPDKIEESFLKGVQDPKTTPQDPTSYMMVLSKLSDHSLVSRTASGFSVHRIVQDITILDLDLESRLVMFGMAVDAIWMAFPKQINGLLMSSDLDRCESCLPHVEALERRYWEHLETPDGYGSNSQVLHFAELAYTCSWSMYEKGLLSKALHLAQTGMRVAESFDGETRLLQADLWTTIGAAQHEKAGMMLDGYESLEKALNLRLAAMEDGLIDSTDPQIANSYMSLATAASGIGRFKEGLSLAEKSIRLRMGRTNEQMQMLAMSHHNAGIAHLGLGEIDIADSCLQTALEITNTLGESMSFEQQLSMHSRIFYSRANVLLSRNEREEGRELHEKALEVRLRSVPETHPYTACSLWKLATLWEDEDWGKSVSYYRKAIDIYRRLSHVEAQLGRALYNLGSVLSRHGAPDSEECLEEGRRIYASIKPGAFPDTEADPFRAFIHPFYW